MPKQLNDNQFSGYEFRAHRDEMSTSASVAHEGEPLGSISIYRPGFYSAEQDQKNINRGYARHHVGEERLDQRTGLNMDTGQPNWSAQLRWSGGMMDPHPAEVGWLGASEKLPKMALRGMLATAIHAHGSIPHADSTMSEQGARMARGASKKYGMKGASGNKEMRATFPGYFDSDREEAVRGAAGDSWNAYESDVAYGKTEGWRTFDNKQAHEVVQAMDEKYRKPKAPPTTAPLSPGQMRLL